MTSKLDKLINDKIDRLNSVPLALDNGIRSLEPDLFDELKGLLNLLDSKNGVIDINAPDKIERVNEIFKKFAKYLYSDSKYKLITDQYFKEFPAQAQLNNAYFRQIISGFEYKNIFKDNLKASLISAGDHFSNSAIDNVFINPIKTALLRAVNSGDTIAGAAKTLKDMMVSSDESYGRLTRYTKEIAYDTFAWADRNYTQQVEKDYKIEWYVYRGRLIDDSRPFCVERANKYWHRKEIEAWATLKWSGKVNSTDKATIFTYLGGWRCQHSLIAVSIFSVPIEDIRRAIKKGFVKKADLPQKVKDKL